MPWTVLARSIHSIRIVAAVLVGLMVLGMPSLSYAETGSVRIVVNSAGFIFGVGGGRGTLRFRGQSYALGVGGVSVGTIGIAQADLQGRAYNLRRARDIAGTYTQVAGSVAIAGGVRSVRLRNSNGVVLVLSGRQAGFEASLSLSGMTISLR